MKRYNSNTEEINFVDIKEKIRLEDYRYGALSKRFQYVYLAMVVVYLIPISIHIFLKDPFKEILSAVCFLLAMLIFAIGFKRLSKEYTEVDYSQPTLMMLKKAADRYKPFRSQTVLLIPAVLLINIGLSVKEHLIENILWLQVGFVVALLVATGAGLLVWKMRYKHLRDSALNLIRQLEGE